MSDEPREPDTDAGSRKGGAYRNVTPEKLIGVLADHAAWLHSGGKRGARADLRGGDLTAHDLCNADLRQADLSGANLQGLNLSGTDLRSADLRDANLRNARNLMSRQLGGADLSGAQLSEGVTYNAEIANINDQIRDAGRTLAGLMVVCVFSLLTLGTTTDTALLTSSGVTVLPVVSVSVPILGFLYLMPLAILGIYLNFQVYLQRLWENLAEVPAVFPDGTQISKRLYPWLPTGLISSYMPRLKGCGPPLCRLQVLLSVLLVWWVVPAILHCFWGRSLCAHNWYLTALHLGVLSVSIVAAVAFVRLASGTLRGGSQRDQSFKEALSNPRTYGYALLLLTIGGIYADVSLGAITGQPSWLNAPPHHTELGVVEGWGPSHGHVPLNWHLRNRWLYWPYADLSEAVVSTKPDNYTGEDVTAVKGAPLKSCDLRHLDADSAFLANADLRYTDLRNSVLTGADLRCARFLETRLDGADLRCAILRGAHLQSLSLIGARLRGADLSGAQLAASGSQRGGSFKPESGTVTIAFYAPARGSAGAADLSRADLMFAKLRGADMGGVNLAGANLISADLTGAHLLGANLMRANLTDAVLEKADLSVASLSLANLTGADMRDARMIGADLTGTHLDAAVLGGGGRDAKGLTPIQLRKALFDESTWLPSYLEFTRRNGKLEIVARKDSVTGKQK